MGGRSSGVIAPWRVDVAVSPCPSQEMPLLTDLSLAWPASFTRPPSIGEEP